MAEFDQVPQGPNEPGSVHYQAQAPDARMQCGMCKNFIPPASCGLVAGRIDPAGTCDLFQPLPPEDAGEGQDPEAAMMAQLFGG